MTKLVMLTRASKGPEAVLYALVLRRHLIDVEFFSGIQVLFPTKKRRAAAAVRDKITTQTRRLLEETYPGHAHYEIQRLATSDKEGDASFPRYLLRIRYPYQPGQHRGV